MNGSSWGNYPQPTESEAVRPPWRDRIASLLSSAQNVLPRGLGRSYGDSCQLSDGSLIEATDLDRILAFDRATGVIRVEAGISLVALLRVIIPSGWFIAVSPGTKFVTVGGAIANDIHGKNHHQAGTFGSHVRSFELIRSDGTVRVCSPTEETEYFGATIGGLGLTGFISWAELQLIPIASSKIRGAYTPFSGVKAFLELSDRSTAPYTVAWIDTSSQSMPGIFMEGWHAESGDRAFNPKSLLTVPMTAPSWLLAGWSIKIFNRVYGALQRALPAQRKDVSLDTFFYPLDVVGSWNKLYGARGFLQYQFVVPEARAEVVDEVLSRLRQAGHLSFLTVLKKMGEHTSPGWLSFPREGLTLALDLPNAPGLLALLEGLDGLILAAGGRIYPAKDARMSAETFQKMYPRWRELEALRDPKVTSDFWRRVTASK